MGNPGSAALAGQTQQSTSSRGRIVYWALWDCGSTGLNAIVVTFVFSVYLTSVVGEGMPGGATPATWLGVAMFVAGVAVALLAPVTGVLVEAPSRRRRALVMLTVVAVTLTAAMSLIRDDVSYLFPGLALLALTAACSDLASVPYNAMLRQLSTADTAGRISGFGWAAGYLGSVLLLVLVYVCFISGDGDTTGLFGVPAADGQNVRAAVLMTAVWMAVFATPLLLTAHRTSAGNHDVAPSLGIGGAYRKLATDVAAEWRRDRNLVYYLLASAIFRDGLSGVFAFGAVLGASVYGISQANVLLFGVAACLVAAVGAVAGGLLDDRVGSKPVIVGSLASVIVVGLVLLTLSGPLAFWVCGLLLCLFVGPSQSAARTLLLRMSDEGKEGVAFGLYTTTGRAVSFLAPSMFALFVYVFGADRAGMGGLCAVLAVGLVAMLFVKTPRLADGPAADRDP
ncbi:MAG: MFS transporter [Mycobacterium sp.]